ncbi:MAG: 16S rRNA (cytosine(967)-C(5))-methyltransferase RsmB [Candidatus Neomarinimicrobiota bacterium]|nr:16S rRNA (cytosine(967)-C(5))-methyltransferase RsmB [Candidatus Neomarinimicrobiota bacterium]
MSEKRPAREHTVAILDRFDRTGARLSKLFSDYFDSNKVSKRSRPEITHLVQEIVRRRGVLDHVIGSLFTGNYVKADRTLKNGLRLGAYEILFREHVPDFAAVDEAVKLVKRRRGKGPAGLTNALLRKVRAAWIPLADSVYKELPLSESSALLSHPAWLMEKWIASFGWERAERLCDWNNRVPNLMVRMNPLKTDRDIFESFLTVNCASWNRSQIIPEFYTVTRVSKLRESHQFRDGHFSFQDVSSGLIVALLNAEVNEAVLDVCAAPGGKASALAERMENKGTIHAFDVDETRVALLKETVNRLGLSSVSFLQKDATSDTFPESGKILIDAPCSGTGVMGKRADLKWRRKQSDIDELVGIQTDILSHCSKFLWPDGEIVYATCSLEGEENWGVVDTFLSRHSDFSPISVEGAVPGAFIDKRGALATFPPEHGTDGVFGVILKRDR